MNNLWNALSELRISATGALCALLLLSGTVYAQDEQRRELYNNPEKFNQLSSAAQIMLRKQFGPHPGEKVPSVEVFPGGTRWSITPEQGNNLLTALVNTLVNNPAADATAQDTQSETAIVLSSGSNIIAGFNDSGSFIGGASKFTGFSTSANGGTSWTDGGTLPTNPVGDAGDPVLARDNVTGETYFATLQFSGNGVAVFKSVDNGATWGLPAQGAPGAGGFQDKEWITVDNFAGSGQGNVYLAYRDFGSPGGIRMTRSIDHGATFGPSPGLLLSNASAVQGAYVTVGTDHAVYVFYFNGTTIAVRKSTDLGLTFAPAVTVAPLTSTATNGDLTLPAGFRSSSFPAAAVNNANGNLYVVYNNPTAASGGDRGNILFRQSIDGGATWSAAVQVNDDATTRAQYMPTLAVKPDGSGLSVTWYDNRNDPANQNIERWGVTATVSGPTVTFGSNFRISPSFVPTFGGDPVVNSVYMGDYDMMAADNTNFHTLWGDNRDQSTAVPSRKNANVRHAQFTIDGPGAIPSFVSALVGPGGGNGNSLIDRNECNDIFVTIGNDGNQPATGVSATLATSTPEVSVPQPTESFTDIAVHGTSTNATAFKISTSPTFTCGTTISFTLTVNYSGGTEIYNFTLPSNSAAGASSLFENTTTTPIPDVTTTNIPITVSGFTDAIGKVTIGFYLTHTFDSDLNIFLISPDNTTVELTTGNGSSGDNYGSSCSAKTVFDDAAATSITAGTAPFVGTFRPEGSLAAFNGKSGVQVNGQWTLRITDAASGDFGTFQCASLSLFASVCLDGGGGCGITSAPTVNSPIFSGATSVSGTSTEADGTLINVFVNSSSVGTTTVSSGAWTKGGLLVAHAGIPSKTSGAGLIPGDTVKATATATGKSESIFSNQVIVYNSSITFPPVVNSPINHGATSVSGTSAEANGTAIQLYVNSSAAGTTAVSGGNWTVSGLSLVAFDTVKATATASGKSVSPFSNQVIVQGIAPAFTSSLPPNGGVGSPYNHTFTATGAPAPTFSVTGTLPPGVSLVGNSLTGSPTTPGTYSGLSAHATNGVLPDATQNFTIVIANQLPATIAVSPDTINITTPVNGTGSGNLTVSNTAVAGAKSLNWSTAAFSGTRPQVKAAALQYHLPGPAVPKGTGEAVGRVNPPVTFGAGGPDVFGYRWIDSDQPGGPTFGWVDISGSGTALDSASAWVATGINRRGDEGYFPVALPFSFSYYGVLKDSVFIGTNGNVMFQRPTADTYANNQFPTAGGAIDNHLGVFWDDLEVRGPGRVYFGTSGGNFVVQYNQVCLFNSSTPNYTFELVLKPSGEWLYQYLNMSINGGTLTSSSIGMENATGTIGISVAFNAAYVHNNLAVRFFLPAPCGWIASVTPPNGVIAPGGHQDATVGADATGLSAGTYHCAVYVSSDASNTPLVIVPVNLTVQSVHNFVVVNTNDAGAGSLRAAITAANAQANLNPSTPDTIVFNIPGSGAQTILVQTELPAVTDPVIIDGYSQPGASENTLALGDNAALKIVLSRGGSADNGLTISAGNTTVQGLVINQFQVGIRIVTNGSNTIRGNFIGTDVTGTLGPHNINGVTIEGAPNNTVGGSTPGDRNIISSNTANGVQISAAGSTGNKVTGNYIGTDATGTTDLGNGSAGVQISAPSASTTVGGTTAGERNIISGNNADGVRVGGASSNSIMGNYIGTDATGTAPLGNTLAGVHMFVSASNNTVGGTVANSGNIIAFNGGQGVLVENGTGNAIDPNSIFGNGGLGIDLGSAGVTPNDPGDGDVGANNLQNFPEMTQSQRQSNGDLSVTYSVPSSVANSAYPLRIEFFKAQGGQGKTFLSAQSYAAANAQLAVTQTFTPAAAVNVGDTVIATATDSLGNTSEFSGVSIVIPSDPSGIISDDFNTASLKPFWTFINPGNPSAMSLVGTGTADARLRIQIPDGPSHDVWTSGNMAPRVMQNCNNIDFEVEVKFDGQMTSQYQIEGIIVEQDANTFLRFDFVKDNSGTRAFAAQFTGGSPTPRSDLPIASGNPSWMRVKRQGNTWTQSYSYDGVHFTVSATFDFTLNVSKIGPFVGNAGYPEGTAPAFTGLVDYFFSTASPIVPEDGVLSAPTITQQPANATVQTGQTATFTVAATGTIPLAYQWQKNSSDIGGATNPSYTTPSVSGADNGASFRCVVSNSVGTVTSNAAILTVTAVGNASGIMSDDFNAATLKPFWTYINPAAPSTLTLVGTGTQDARLSIAVPAGSAHDVWIGANNAPRIMQPMNNTDFEVEVKFEQPMSAGYQLEGVIVEQSPGNYLRFGFVHDFSNTRLFAASFTNNNPSVKHDINITGSIGSRAGGGTVIHDYLSETGTVAQGAKSAKSAENIVVPVSTKAGTENDAKTAASDGAVPVNTKGGPGNIGLASASTLYLRVKRTGNSWTEYYSTNGSDYFAAPAFTQALTASSVGPYIGNAGSTPSNAPAFTGLIDYFFNTATPISPEDGTPSAPSITSQPQDQSVGAGQAATFAIGVSGSTPLAFKWQKNNVDIPLATNPSYTTPSTTLGDDGTQFRCIVSNAVGTVTSNNAILHVTSVSNPSGIFSDDFHNPTLDNRWVATNPAPASSFSLVGSNTTNARLSISIPSGQPHDIWTGGNNAPRIMQPANNTDFEVEVKFEQTMTAAYQIEGILAQQDATNFVRFGFVKDNGNTRVFAASFVNGVPTTRTDINITQSNPMYVRVNRTGNSWLQTYSNDGTNFISVGPFTFPLTVSSVGLYAGNASLPSTPAPAFTMLADYFFNTAFPIVPEDGGPVVTPPPGGLNGGSVASIKVVPTEFSLGQNFPNPFNPSTTISYGLPEQANVTLKVYNTLGQEMAVLTQGEQAPGMFRAVWDGRNKEGNTVGSGVYLYRIVAIKADGKSFTSMGKMILMK